MTVSVTTRAVKGAKLTFTELDTNFTVLRDAVNAARLETQTITTSAFSAATKQVILADATANPQVVTLPDATLAANLDIVYIVKKIDLTTNLVMVDTTLSQTIDGVLTVDLVNQYDTLFVISDGANWHTIIIKKDVVRAFYIQPNAMGKPTTNLMTDSLLGAFPVVLADDTTQESRNFSFQVPDDWKLGTDIDIFLNYINVNSQSGINSVVLGIDYVSIADNEDSTPALTTVEITDTLANNELAEISHQTAKISVSSANLSLNDTVGVNLFRKASDASDTVTGDIAISRLQIKYTAR